MIRLAQTRLLGMWKSLLYCRFMPESLRWLLLKGKSEKVMKLVRKLAKSNNVPLPENLEIQLNISV